MSIDDVTAGGLPSGLGLSDPTLSLGLSGVSDWSTEMPFLDIAHTMRPWIGHEGSTWSAMTYEELRDGGYLDEHGWLKEIPAGLDSVGTIWDWGGAPATAAQSRSGIYVLTYEGEGRIEMTLGAKVLSSEPGRIVFENATGTTMAFNILATDPSGTGDYIRDISVVPAKYEALAEAGEIFNPDWLPVVQDARVLRFMDWMNTNNSNMTDWTDRPQLDDATWAPDGVPVEVMVALANQTGTDPWFTMPAKASDEYIREFATYVRDHLDPSLRAHVEYSNETWNWAFEQTGWLDAEAKAAWGEGTNLDYFAKRATETALIWDQIFGDQADARIENVLAVQNGSDWWLDRILNDPIWAAHEPDTYVSPASVFDSVAVTTYFGSATVSDEALRDELISVLEDPGIDATAWLAARLTDPSYNQSIPQIEANWAAINAVADRHGLDLIAYEGGQHVHHSFAVSGLSSDVLTTLTDFMTEFVRSPEMAELYSDLWDAWARISDGPFMQFGDVGAPGKWGSWGLLSDLGDTNPRAAYLFEQNASVASWFGDGGGTRYQQGVTKLAGDDGEFLTGTQKADFLIGGDGDDTIVPGMGQDGINGGSGIDTVILQGTPGDHAIARESAGYGVTGPGISHFVINVEYFEFDGEVRLSLEQMLAGENPVPENKAPAITSNGGGATAGMSVAENGTAVTRVTAVDPDAGATLTYAIVGGADQARFTIDAATGVLAFKAAPDFEAPTDAGANNVYHVSIEVGDGLGGTDTQAIAITVTNQNEAADRHVRIVKGTKKDDVLGAINDREAKIVAGDWYHIWGKGGDDTIVVGLADDILIGGTGDDSLRAGAGDDVLNGGAGIDRLKGQDGDDDLSGCGGEDLILGGSGDDVVDGGAGSDRLFGGTGADLFRFTGSQSPRATPDKIADFNGAEGDRIDLSGVRWKVSVQGPPPFDFIGERAFSGKSGELRFKDGYLSGDLDGDGRTDFRIEIVDCRTLDVSDLILA